MTNETRTNKVVWGAGLAVTLLSAAGLYLGFGGDCSDEKLADKIVRTQLKENTSLEIKNLIGTSYFANFPTGSERILYAYDFNSDGKYDRIKEKIISSHIITSNYPPDQNIYERILDNPKDKEFLELEKKLEEK
mgnify:CR=1 FL=1